MKHKLISFSIDAYDLFIYLLAWVSLWYIYDYYMVKYIGEDREKQHRVNLFVFLVSILLLLLRNLCIYPYKPW